MIQEWWALKVAIVVDVRFDHGAVDAVDDEHFVKVSCTFIAERILLQLEVAPG
jgi:hypothetical protein